MCAAIAVGAALLFLGYLRVSWTVAVTSDGAAQALQARDMLAGNWLLRGWTLSDVSFYPTELPEYVLVELVRPLGTGVIHVAAAVTYTLLVLAAFLLARGRARGLNGLVSGVIAAVIMLAPQLGYGAFVLLLSPDHVGTQVPLLLGWLLLDRAPRRWWVPACLCLLLALAQFADRVAVLTAVLPLVVVCAASAVRSVLGSRSGRRVPAGRQAEAPVPTEGPAQPRPAWRYELTLAGAAIVSVGLSWAAARVLTAAGGFAAHPFPLTLAPPRLLWTHTWLTGWGILELYGANFLGISGWAGLTFAAVHLIGLALAVAGFAVAFTRFIRPRRPADPSWRGRAEFAGWRIIFRALGRKMIRYHASRSTAARLGPARRARRAGKTDASVVSSAEKPGRAGSVVDSVLAVAIVANVLSYLLSIEPGTVLGTGYDAREIAAVLPLGAVLAGRVFAGRVFAGRVFGPRTGFRMGGGRRRGWVRGTGGAKTRDRLGSSALVLLGVSLVAAAYGVAFGYSAARPAVGGRDSVLAGWLVAHGLRYGLAGVSANVATVDSGGRVVLATTAVRRGRVGALRYQSTADAYDPRLHDANFLVTGVPADGVGYAAESVPSAAVRATFGRPARVYRFDGYTVGVWNVNLLTKLRE
jgi:hypothetical protein